MNRRSLLLFIACAVVSPSFAPAARAETATPQWIWLGKEPAKARDRVFLRKVFEVAGKLKEASLIATCDSRMEVQVNGHRVLESNAWRDPLRCDLTKQLVPGKNVVFVRGTGSETSAGLVARIRYVLKNGNTGEVVSDASWIGSREYGPGLESLNLDTSAWTPATTLAALGSGPWADAIDSATFEAAQPLAGTSAASADKVAVLDGFQVERLYSVPGDLNGSWVALAADPKGRITASDQYGSLYRFTPPARGVTLNPDDIEKLEVPFDGGEFKGAHGLLYAFDGLYAVQNEGKPRGLYRLRDTNGDDQFDEVKLLREFGSGGEHGPHSVILTPDGKSLYVNAGNHTDLPKMEKSVVPRVWQEDLLLPRQWDARGHARGRLAPGGWIARTDPDGKEWELVSIGYRNEFDIALSPEGDLFTYDADMEWDVGTPWYRPTRVNHATSGSEFGWRSGTGKWPEYYPDSLGSVIDIGPGSPTGIVFGTGARFPEKYQRALYICDWSYGKLYAVHLEPDGATWKGSKEQFMAASPLPLTDLLVHPGDGAMYVAVGGRRTQSGLYRITHKDAHTAKSLAPRVNPESELRRELERHHANSTAGTVRTVWTSLAHPDRTVRYAARIAVEQRPVEEWQEQALNETRPLAIVESTIALARHADPAQASSLRPRMLANLGRVRWEASSEADKLGLLRAYGLVFIRLGKPPTEVAAQLAATLDPYLPAPSYALNRELTQLLVYLDSDRVVDKGLALLATASTQEEQIHYAFALRVAEKGWDLKKRSAYFEWFHRGKNFRGGASFGGFLQNIKSEAVERLSEDEKTALADVLQEKAAPAGSELPKPKGPGQEWDMQSLFPLVQKQLRGRNFEHGKTMFTAASCFVCHRFGGEGGAVGPDLTGLAGRFAPHALLESLIDPSKVVSDQYEATIFQLRDGNVVVGRIVNMGGDRLMINTDMLDAGQSVSVNHRRIVATQPSPTSMMPEGLLNTLNEEEVLDLMAYLLSRGDPGSPLFQR
jgi:putative heme-binding domain-containing protein